MVIGWNFNLLVVGATAGTFVRAACFNSSGHKNNFIFQL